MWKLDKIAKLKLDKICLKIRLNRTTNRTKWTTFEKTDKKLEQVGEIRRNGHFWKSEKRANLDKVDVQFWFWKINKILPLDFIFFKIWNLPYGSNNTIQVLWTLAITDWKVLRVCNGVPTMIWTAAATP